MTKYTVVYTEEAEGGFSGRCLELPGAISQGETLEELRVNITDAIQLMLAPDPSPVPSDIQTNNQPKEVRDVFSRN
jgi:predicted RNase H-like HicB family nuclease